MTAKGSAPGVKVTACCLKLTPKDRKPGSGGQSGQIKTMTPVSHSAAFFHFSNRKKSKTELVLLSCGGAALISARHSFSSAFAFDLSPSRLSPHQSGRNKKRGNKRDKGKKEQTRKKSQQWRGEETKAPSIQLKFSCA